MDRDDAVRRAVERAEMDSNKVRLEILLNEQGEAEERARILELVDETCKQKAEMIKHTSHTDGLGMGDQRRENLCLELCGELKRRIEEGA